MSESYVTSLARDGNPITTAGRGIDEGFGTLIFWALTITFTVLALIVAMAYLNGMWRSRVRKA